jgi:23S rRNA pseudouridine2605 synthase
MEEKKKRPRITKPGGGFSLKERPKIHFPGDENDRTEEGSEKKSFERDRNFSEDRPFNRDRNDSPPDRPFNRDRSDGPPDRPYNRDQNSYGQDRPYNRDRNDGPPDRPYNRDRSGGYGQDRPYNRDRNDGPPDRPYNRDRSGGYGQDRPYNRDRNDGPPDRPYNRDRSGSYGQDRPYNRDRNDSGGGFRKPFGNKGFGNKGFKKKEEFFVEKKPKPALPSGEEMPLNKYLAHCGVASRRKAVEYIEKGVVTVNGEVRLEPYYRIQKGDMVTCEGKPMQIQERLVYILLNKPKNVITTTDDEHGRATVLDIVDPNFPERLYPVGRLDRDTTGLILITNDGDLAQKLSHPSYKILKQYRVGLDHGLTEADYDRIVAGVELEDGTAPINWIRFAEDHPNRDIVELEIVVGRNRIVRRIFESLGYKVRKLDRFYYAGLTKKELPRGAFRELTQREIIMLKHFTGHPSSGPGEAEKEKEAEG